MLRAVDPHLWIPGKLFPQQRIPMLYGIPPCRQLFQCQLQCQFCCTCQRKCRCSAAVNGSACTAMDQRFQNHTFALVQQGNKLAC